MKFSGININRNAYNKSDIKVTMFILSPFIEIDITNYISSINFNKNVVKKQIYGLNRFPIANLSGQVTSNGNITVYTPFLDMINSYLKNIVFNLITPSQISLDILNITDYFPVSIYINYISQNGDENSEVLSNIHFTTLNRSITENNIELISLDFNITNIVKGNDISKNIVKIVNENFIL